MKEEICEECSRIIGLAEQAYVCEGRIVCEQCDRELRQEPQQAQELQDTWKPEEVAEFQEPKEPQKVQESTDIFESLKAPEPEDFAEFHEFEDVREPKEPQKVQESEQLSESPETPESEELEEYRKPEKLKDLIEAPELQAGPVEAEQAADVPIAHTPKPSPRKHKRIKRTKSTLLPVSLAAWSLLSLFLIFYVPVRYESELKSYAFGNGPQAARFTVECVIVSFMVLWFLGALMLYIATTFTQKDEK